MQSITIEEYRAITKWVDQLTGIVLDDGKRYLVETRLGPILAEYTLSNYGGLLDLAKRNPSLRIEDKVIDAITTNETFFFRENAAFELLKFKLVPDRLDSLRKANSPAPVRIWSAAASTGQEIYTMAIALYEGLGAQILNKIRLEGSDISESTLKRASEGVYSQLEVGRGMPVPLLQKYFHPVPRGWKVRDDLRAMCSFRRLNLLQMGIVGIRYDIIFCRNVAIYFAQTERATLFRNLANLLVPGGALVVGATESVRDCGDLLRLQTKYHNCFYYERI